MQSLFSVEERDRVRAFVLELAAQDGRVVAGAEVGSLAVGEGDRWSDLDLTFAVADEVSISDVLAEWTSTLADELDAVQLFDLPVGSTVYRVFVVPGLLQVDISFTPVSEFWPRGPKFKLLFGEAGAPVFTPPPSAQHVFGLAVHYAHRARFCIERGKLWQAAYLIGELRNYVLELACLRLGLPARYGRGFDALPSVERDGLEESFVRAVEPIELDRALDAAVRSLRREAGHLGEVATKLEPVLRSLTA
jgi:hypothetical protein